MLGRLPGIVPEVLADFFPPTDKLELESVSGGAGFDYLQILEMVSLFLVTLDYRNY